MVLVWNSNYDSFHMGIFLISSFLLLKFWTLKVFISFIHLFIHSYTQMWIHRFLFYSLGYNLLLPLFILMFKLSQIWTVGAPSDLLLYPMTRTPIILWAISSVWHSKYSRIILNLQLWNHPFSIVPVSFGGNGVRDQNLVTRYALSY